MFNISIYLDKFKNFESKKNSLKNDIIDSINNTLKININKKDVKIINQIVYLKVNPVIKNEIFINKIDIIKQLTAKNLIIKGIF